jgi:hypothetical protein
LLPIIFQSWYLCISPAIMHQLPYLCIGPGIPLAPAQNLGHQ